MAILMVYIELMRLIIKYILFYSIYDNLSNLIDKFVVYLSYFY